jgi:hypothetical protein
MHSTWLHCCIAALLAGILCGTPHSAHSDLCPGGFCDGGWSLGAARGLGVAACH